jgi:hypothetical protein
MMIIVEEETFVNMNTYMLLTLNHFFYPSNGLT